MCPSAPSRIRRPRIWRGERALRESPEAEVLELARIYEKRGLSPALAKQVAAELTAHDALATHARDEIGLSEGAGARPTLAASASAAAYSIGAALPILTAFFTATERIALSVPGATIVSLAALGAVGGRIGGASSFRPALRSVLSGVLAMGVTAAIGWLVGGIA